MAGFVIGVDVGTTSVSLVPVTSEGMVLPARSREHHAGIPSNRSWESLQDPRKLLQTAVELLEESRAELGSPDAVGICGQMHGAVYINSAGEAVSPLYTWLDGRGNLATKQGDKSYAAYLSAQTGLSLASGFAVVTDYVLRRQGDVPADAASVGTVGDYVAAALAGLSRPVMDASQAHSFGAYDFSTGDWTRESLREIGFPTHLLPEIAPTGTVIGEWRNAPGTRVTSCVGDNQASVLGAAQDFWSDCILSLGTSGQISVHLPEAVSPHPAIDVRPFPGEGYLGVGASLTAGKAYQTLRDFLDQVCVRLGGTTVGAVTYQKLNGLAEELLDELVAARRDVVHDPDLPRVDTRFLGTRNNPKARASISNLTPWNFTPGSVVLGLLSGMVGELHHLFSLLPAQVRAETRRLCLSGNALRRNSLLRRLAELHFRLPGYVPTYSEEAAVGAALVAGVGVGTWPNYEAACRSVG